MLKPFIAVLLLALFASCNNLEQDLSKSESAISTERMKEYIIELGSDNYQGRKPFSHGESLTIEYLQKCYKTIGLEPANGDSYLQEVPMVMIKGQVKSPLIIKRENEKLIMNYSDDFVAFSRKMTPELSLDNSEMIFAGYGIVAPEYGWNDYENLDVKGKTVVVLVNDPGLDSGHQDFFTGNAMTYYGRWTYKYEEAARQGAKGILIIHDDKGAGYPWSVVVNSAAVAKVYPQPSDNFMNRCELEGWIHQDKAKELFDLLALDFNAIVDKAKQPNFKGFCLNSSATVQLNNSWETNTSYNVMGMIKGREKPDEYVFYTAHWDHLGIGKVMNGDSIYNGAVDNGTSLAWLLEIAHAFKAMPSAPDRSIVFMAPTAEESGLNGSGYYADNPVFPIEKTLANINNDLMLPFGRCKDVMITGYGKSDLDDLLEMEAKKQGRYILPDPNAHTGMYYRSDHFSFARVGVPAIFARGNNDHWEKGKEYMQEKEQWWINNCYHKPDDEYEDWWDLSGIKQDAQLLFRVGWAIANADTYPKWKEGSEFKEIRDKQFE